MGRTVKRTTVLTTTGSISLFENPVGEKFDAIVFDCPDVYEAAPGDRSTSVNVKVIYPLEDYKHMGCPSTITMTIEQGDQLNELAQVVTVK